jgi:UDP-4-amino-4-deoxy-L-arabinose formyltransferase/UDP-glucuronic acid dehydrogenase (UDP-4-keto-hexauronic acid decarboxylating)
MILRLLGAAEQDRSKIPSIPQDLSKREYFGREVPHNGNLSWRLPAREIFNFVRACDFSPFRSPWGHPRAGLGDCEIGIVKVQLTGKPAEAAPGTVDQTSHSGVAVACADEWILVQQLFHQGKYLPATAKLRSGDRLKDGTAPAAPQP